MMRPAGKEDLGSVTDCIAAAYSAFQTTIPDLPPVLDGIGDAIDDGRVWLVEDASGVAGVLILKLGRDHAVLENVAVTPRSAGKGLGRVLIDQALTVLRDHGCAELRLNTHASMTGNVAMYERLGWKITATIGNRISMSKAI